jgi:disulfide bond formation protein DsbB
MEAKLRQQGPSGNLLEFARARPVVAAAVVVIAGSAFAVLGAWYFQYVLGYPPCPLCYEQRYPYYFAMPLAVLIILGESVGSRRRVLLGGLLALAGMMLWNAGLGVYHAGIEWKWWLGPQSCAAVPGTLAPGGGNLADTLKTINITRCDEAAWRSLGISLAGYNALIALSLAAVAVWGFLGGRRSYVERDLGV